MSGALVDADSAGLTIAAADGSRRLTLPLDGVARLDVYAGRRSATAAFGRGALRGARIGVGLGTELIAAALVSEGRHPCSDCFIDAPAAAAIVSVPLTAPHAERPAAHGPSGRMHSSSSRRPTSHTRPP